MVLGWVVLAAELVRLLPLSVLRPAAAIDLAGVLPGAQAVLAALTELMSRDGP
jgi:hypothetical protein